MPEQVRLKVGGVTPQQMAVYEEFARNIPGFQPMTDKEAAMCTPKNVSEEIISIVAILEAEKLMFVCNSLAEPLMKWVSCMIKSRMIWSFICKR